MGKKKATKTHNDLDDLPEEATPEVFDEEDPSDVLGIDIPKAKGDAKAKPIAEPDERPGEDVLAAVAEEAAEGEEADQDDEGTEEGEGEEISAEADETGEAERDADETRRIRLERDGEVVELEVSAKQAAVLEAYMNAADTTRRKYAELQERHVEVLQGATRAAPPPATATPTHPAEVADARLNRMMQDLPQIVEAYTPVLEWVKKNRPEDDPLREFAEDRPVIAAVIASLVDASVSNQAQAAAMAAERAQNSFRDHVNNLIENIITSDEANAVLADPDTRKQFDTYLVSLGPRGENGQHDPTPVRAALMRDDGSWLAERWRDFRLRAAFTGAKPDGEDAKPKTRTPTDLDRRRAIDPGGSTGPAVRTKTRTSPYAQEVLDVLSAK